MKYWHEFLQFDYANEVLLAAGALFIIIGVMQIVRSSIKMLFWVIIAGVGAFSFSYGMQQGSYTIPGMEHLRGANLNTIASNIDSDVLEFLCQKLDATRESAEKLLSK